MTKLTILASHPYWQFADVDIYFVGGKMGWKVRWRDFMGVAQKWDFATESEALTFAERNRPRPPMTIDDEDYGNDELLAESDQEWHDMARWKRERG